MDNAAIPEPPASGLPVPRPVGGRELARPTAREAFPVEWQQTGVHVAEEPIDLVGYWHVLVKHWPVVVGAIVLALLVALASTLLTTKIYRATSTLQIDREALKVVEFEGDQRSVESGSGTDFLQTQYELLRSRAIAQRVVSRLSGQGGATVAAPGTRPAGAPRDEAALLASQHGEVAAVMAGLTIEPVRNSRLVHVNFDSPDPQRAASVANAVGDAFIASTLERRFEASAYAKSYLEDRLAQLKTRLEASERELVRFAQAEHIVSGADGQSLSGQNLAELNTSLAQAQAQRIRAEARWNQASHARGANLPADMLTGSILHTLQDRRAQLEAQYQDKLGVYKAAFPSMVQLKGQIDELDRQIAAELVDIRASVRSEYEAAQKQEQLLTEKMVSIRGDELDLQSRSIRYNILKREVDTNRQLYDALLQRYKEIGVAGGVSTNNVSVVDRAEVPASPFKPSLSRNLALGLLAGLMLGIAGAFLREHADDTVRHPEQLEHLFGLAVLGTVPLLKAGHTPMPEAEDLRSGFSESYRSIRTALQFSTDTGVPKSLLVTSASPGEGKTTTALLLARNLAQLGKSVLLIDADLRNPSLHRLLALPREEGLSNLLAGAATMDAIVQPGGAEGLSVIRSGPLPPNPAELLASPRMRALLQSAMGRYDQVILDGPPIMGLADATLLAHMAEGTLLMVACGRTRRGVLRSALKRMAAARAHVTGAVLTMFDPRRTAFGYGDNAYEYYAYGTPTPKAIGRG